MMSIRIVVSVYTVAMTHIFYHRHTETVSVFLSRLAEVATRVEESAPLHCKAAWTLSCFCGCHVVCDAIVFIITATSACANLHKAIGAAMQVEPSSPNLVALQSLVLRSYRTIDVELAIVTCHSLVSPISLPVVATVWVKSFVMRMKRQSKPAILRRAEKMY
ncbi:hypothetical protein ONE63_001654 [Megalurothrips usitatus]|uniref:Uncharacterized protein n=1 Tax=Megalurothrips usitatus TaxID=439358 RepID=A0AAV7XFW2_9NEOP|nr:hypothetical protein ONE63_001654 [Megalurothrips usitatus]